MCLHNCRWLQEHLRLLLQSLRAHCKAPGGAGSIWKNLEALVRATGVSGRFVWGFQTDLHFADVNLNRGMGTLQDSSRIHTGFKIPKYIATIWKIGMASTSHELLRDIANLELIGLHRFIFKRIRWKFTHFHRADLDDVVILPLGSSNHWCSWLPTTFIYRKLVGLVNNRMVYFDRQTIANMRVSRTSSHIPWGLELLGGYL